MSPKSWGAAAALILDFPGAMGRISPAPLPALWRGVQVSGHTFFPMEQLSTEDKISEA